MGMRIHYDHAKATSKLISAINSYMFEEEFGELKKATPTQLNKIKEARKALYEIIELNSTNKK